MILEVLAHSRQVVDRLHPDVSEVTRLAHSRQQEQLGRVDGASAQDDLSSPDPLGHSALHNLNPHSFLALKDDPSDEDVIESGEVLPGEHGAEVGGGGAPPHALVDGGVHPAHPLLLVAVHILG